MKTLKDTVDGMLSEKFEDRLIAEIEQLDIRIYNLEKRINKISKDDPEYGFLNTQYVHMTDYINDLLSRAKAMNVEVVLPSIENRIHDVCSDAETPSDFNLGNGISDPMFWLIVLALLTMNRNNTEE